MHNFRVPSSGLSRRVVAQKIFFILQQYTLEVPPSISYPNHLSHVLITSPLKMESVCSLETSKTTCTTIQCHNPEVHSTLVTKSKTFNKNFK